MASLDPYTTLLTAKTAAHLLRRATFGPTQAEIVNFTGLTAAQAVQQLISHANYSPPPPIDLDRNQPTAGQTYLDKPFNHDRNFDFGAPFANEYVKVNPGHILTIDKTISVKNIRLEGKVLFTGPYSIQMTG